MKKIILLISFFVVIYNVNFAQISQFNTFEYINFERYLLDKNIETHLSIKEYDFEKKYSDTSKGFWNGDINIVSIQGKKHSLTIKPLLKLRTSFDIKNKKLYSDLRGGLSANYNFNKKIQFNYDFFAGRKTFSENTQNFIDSFNVIPHYGKPISDKLNVFLSHHVNLRYKPTYYLNFDIGNGNSFFGNGYRSLFLSDNSSLNPYFKTTVDIWKIKYVWLISQLQDNLLFGATSNFNIDKKYTFSHYFSYNITKRINFNFFEVIITNPYDEAGYKGIEMAYFNPVAFYRPIEFGAGTYDNAMMGMGLNIRLWKTTFLYSQLILDDFIIAELKANNGWWGNKYGMQAGFKTYSALNIRGLFMLGEINAVTPFTYSHQRENINYGHQRQAQAHPLGANFGEAVGIIQYSKNRFSIGFKVILSARGEDVDSISNGGDIYKDYELRKGNYGATFLQGEKTYRQFAELKFSYIIIPKINFAFNTGIQYKNLQNTKINQTNMFVFAGFATNVFKLDN